MNTFVTNTLFLEQLHDCNQRVWHAFDERFRPILVAFAQRLGLQEQDAADAAQETLTQFLRDYRAGKYNRRRGRLRSWIVGIARNRIHDARRKDAVRREWCGESVILNVSAECDLQRIWDEECKSAIVAESMRRLASEGRIADQTIEAFRQLAFGQRDPQDIAHSLNISVDSVYAAKHRCLSRLRSIVADLESTYDSLEQ